MSMIRSFAVIFCVALSCSSLSQAGQESLVSDLPKDVSIANLIQLFAAKEKELKLAHEHYTYTRDISVRSGGCPGGGSPGGYQFIVDVTFDGKGRRSEKTKAESSTLECIYVSEEDLDAFRNQSLFLLTTDEIQHYHFNYVGQQQQDALHLYVFDVSPDTTISGKYFEGRIWVEDHDFQIVRSHGTITSKQIKNKKGQQNIFPAFTSWREQVDGRYRFPTYSKAHDVLHFSTGDVQIDEVVKFTNYKAVSHPR